MGKQAIQSVLGDFHVVCSVCSEGCVRATSTSGSHDARLCHTSLLYHCCCKELRAALLRLLQKCTRSSVVTCNRSCGSIMSLLQPGYNCCLLYLCIRDCTISGLRTIAIVAVLSWRIEASNAEGTLPPFVDTWSLHNSFNAMESSMAVACEG